MNFYPIEGKFQSFKSLIENDSYQIIKSELDNYLNNLSPVQAKKYKQILISKSIRYYLLFLCISETQWSYLDYDLYNIWAADSNRYDLDENNRKITHNKTEKDYERYKLIDSINKDIEDLSHCKVFFKKTHDIVNQIKVEGYEVGVNFFFFKNGSKINSHKHNQGSYGLHYLLHDLNEGETGKVTVNGEDFCISKAGDWFLIDLYQEHSFEFNGKELKFLSFCITPEGWKPPKELN